ncbi:hypothetical protein PUN28_007757 [Cardiocondyla obscurior]|uniref:Uncharacterized protein n=1 Tax=Cardiocondyla obscurior TaxID=286306 RepID=A0AAW2FXL6_9HYME
MPSFLYGHIYICISEMDFRICSNNFYVLAQKKRKKKSTRYDLYFVDFCMTNALKIIRGASCTPRPNSADCYFLYLSIHVTYAVIFKFSTLYLDI